MPLLATVDGPIPFRTVRPCLSMTRPSIALVIAKSFEPSVKQKASKVRLVPSSSETRLGSIDVAERVAFLRLPSTFDPFRLRMEDGADGSTRDTPLLVWLSRGKNSRLEGAFPLAFIRPAWKVDPRMHVVAIVVVPLASDPSTCR